MNPSSPPGSAGIRPTHWIVRTHYLHRTFLFANAFAFFAAHIWGRQASPGWWVLLAGIFLISYLKIALLQLIFKIAIELIFLVDVTGFAKRRSLLVLLPVLNVFHVLYIIYIGIAGNSGKYNWKGRMVR